MSRMDAQHGGRGEVRDEERGSAAHDGDGVAGGAAPARCAAGAAPRAGRADEIVRFELLL